MWNINGIRSTLNNSTFENFMEKAKPDVLCLNETKVDEEALEKEEIKKYVSRWFPLNL